MLLLFIFTARLAWRVWPSPAEHGEPSWKSNLQPPEAARTEPRTTIDARATGVEVHAIPAGVRREVIVSTDELVPAAPAPQHVATGPVRVLGQIRRTGRPLEGYGLSFLSVAWGRDLEECDWDFTGEDGRYEVELPAARYVVRNEDGAELMELIVPWGCEEFALDIDLWPAR